MSLTSWRGRALGATSLISLFAATDAALAFTLDQGQTQTESVVLADDEDFSNAGIISPGTGAAVQADGLITTPSFLNSASGFLSSPQPNAVVLNAVSIFENYGTIEGGSTESGPTLGTVTIQSGVNSFTNTGAISSTHAAVTGAFIHGNVGNFENVVGATIVGGVAGGFVLGDVTSFNNAGILEGQRVGLYIEGASAVDLTNAGTLRAISSTDPSFGLVVRNGVVTNTGAISGVVGIAAEASASGGLEIVNSGTIVGSGGTAIDFGMLFDDLAPGLIDLDNVQHGEEVGRDDILRLLTGSQVMGAVDFGDHIDGDLLDVSQFQGNMVLDVLDLELLKTGSGDPVDFSTFTSLQSGTSLMARNGNQFAIVDAPGATGGGDSTASTVSTVTSEITSIISSQLSGAPTGGTSFSEPLAYSASPSSNPASTAVLSALDVGGPAPEPGTHAWAALFGGMGRDDVGTPLSSVFGGIVAGSHARVAPDVQVGLVGGYVGAAVDVSNGDQRVGTNSGIVGVYGQSQAGIVTLSGSVVAGASAHRSERVSGGQIAVADFGSWFVSPEVGIALALLESDGVLFNAAAKAKYVGGTVGGYTETGGDVNLTLGEQPVQLLDIRGELNGRVDVAATEAGAVQLFGSTGLFVQSNLGGSAVNVTILDTPIAAVSPGTVEYGAYGSVGVVVPLSASVQMESLVNGSVRTDGLMTASGKLKLEASF